MTKPRIAILGGGVGAITAACYLSSDPHRYDITVYQQGWRLGGKGASGRGRLERIEEHGLHIWFGFYENAFRMLHECHDELDVRAASGNPRWGASFTSVEESFRRCSTVAVTDHDGCDWNIWSADFPEDEDQPWLPRTHTWSVAAYAARAIELASAVLGSLFERSQLEPPPASATGAQATLSAAPGTATLEAAAALTSKAAAPGATALLPALDVVLTLIDRVLEATRRRLDDLIRTNDEVRRGWYLVDLLLANVRGAIRDGVIETDDFDIIDDWEYRDWLMHHGALRESVDCALVRSLVYDLAFAYEDGDPTKPRCGAGTALRGLCRTFFGYRGALMFKMNAGMGDVVFAPLYELLSKRGVKFEFFHRVENLKVQGTTITEIEIDVQAQLNAALRPEDFVGTFPPNALVGNGYPTWPNRPTRRLLLSYQKPALYESYWGSARSGDTKTLKHKQDFDLVVFGLSIGSVPYVAHELVQANPRWKASVERVKTVATQAFQMWLSEDATKLGGDWQPEAVVGGFVEPFDTWADMPQLTPQERVSGAATVAYFCNVLQDSALPASRPDQQWVERQDAFVKANIKRFMRRDLRLLWPKFDASWEVGRYSRANIEPSERYVLSVPGSSKYRIAPDDTGFTNLFAVGDWTACGLNAGCVEAAVMSGMRAANAINTARGGAEVPIVAWDEP